MRCWITGRLADTYVLYMSFCIYIIYYIYVISYKYVYITSLIEHA